MLAYGRKILWIKEVLQRQYRLEAQDTIGKKQARCTEEQHRECVMFPIVLLARIDANELIGQPFQRLHDRIEEGLSIRIEHFAKVNSERFGDRQQGDDEEKKLSPA